MDLLGGDIADRSPKAAAKGKAPEALDPSFGKGGKVTVAFPAESGR